MIEEIVEKDINLENAREDPDYLRCIEVQGNTDTNKLVLISINKTQDSNTNLPSRLKVTVAKNKEEFFYHKLEPSASWGKTEYGFTVSEYQETSACFFRLYGSNQPTQESKPTSDEEAQKEPIPTPPEEEKVNDDAEQSVMNCPACTCFNPISNAECEVCGTPLR